MKRLTFEEWMRAQFTQLVGDGAEQLWSDAEDVLKRRRLLDWGVQEGKFSGKFSGERPIRCDLIVPVLDSEGWEKLLLAMTKTARISGSLFASVLPWDEEATQWLFSPAGYFPKEDGEVQPGKFGLYTTALLVELTRRLIADPFLAFQLRGLSKEELLEQLRTARRNVVASSALASADSEAPHSEIEPEVDAVPTDFDWESAAPSLFELSYSLRADELPASLLKRIEPVPLPSSADSVDSVLSEIYAHIAKRAQAYGLSLKGR